MIVLIDTSVWSLAMRRDAKDLNPIETKIRVELGQLINEGRARIIGAIRQELLSGIRDQGKFKQVQIRMRALDDEVLSAKDYENAAQISNLFRSKGVSSTPTDCLICAVAMKSGFSVFTTDKDFGHFAKVVPVALHGLS